MSKLTEEKVDVKVEILAGEIEAREEEHRMGLFSKLFGGKESNKNAIELKSVGIAQKNTDEKRAPEDVQNLVLLALAEGFAVDESHFPNYFRDRYGIGFPKEKLLSLQKQGMLRVSTAAEALSNLKGTELKELAAQNGLKTSGKKEELCAKIVAEVPEEKLRNMVKSRYWKLTDTGKAMLDSRPWISFYLEKHPYSLDEIGIDITSFCNLYKKNPNGRMRDVLWGEFNRLSLELYSKGMTKRNFGEYCSLLRAMALFLEEEGRHKDALMMYCRYLYFRSNINAGISALQYYSYTRKVDETADTLYMKAEIYPFIAGELTDISNRCDIDSVALKAFMIECFKKEKDTSVFTPEELADFVLMGLNGDQAGQKTMCLKAMKEASKKLPRK